MRQRVTFQSRTRAADGAGGFTVTWSDTKTAWAKVEPLSGRETLIAGKVSSNVTHKVTIRSNAVSVNNSMRMVYGGNNYNVRWVREVEERNRVVEVYCELDTPA